MDRGASASVITQIEAEQNQPCHLLEMLFDSQTIYLTDLNRNISWRGQSYQAVGNFLNFSDIEESAELQVHSMTGELSGIGQEFVSLFLTENYIDRTVNLYKAFLNVSQSLVSEPILIFSGRINGVDIKEDPNRGTCSIAMEASSVWIDFNRRPGRRTTNSEQQSFYPNDLGFDFTSEMDKEIVWGRK
jgi:hypothetical protein